MKYVELRIGDVRRIILGKRREEKKTLRVNFLYATASAGKTTEIKKPAKHLNSSL